MGADLGAGVDAALDRRPRAARKPAWRAGCRPQARARLPGEKSVNRPSALRPRGGAAAAALASRLTDRDRHIALDCYRHRVLTTEQLRRLHFRAARTARERLHELRQLGVLASFRPPRQPGEGTSPHHFVLDEAGAFVVAAELGLERAELRWQARAALAVAHSSKLAHQLAVNEFATRLALDARRKGGELERWHNEHHAAQLLEQIVAADAYLRVRLPGRGPLELLLELDRGNEDHARLQHKARRYAKAIPRSELERPLVLLLVPSLARAEHARELLAPSPAPIRVAVWTPERGPAPLDLLHDLTPTISARTHTEKGA